MNIGERIKAGREKLGLSLEDVARRLHVNRSTVQRYESGQTKRIPISTIEKLAGILQTTPEYLMGLDTSRAARDTESMEIIARMKQMSPDKKEMLLKIAKAMSDLADEELKK